MSEALSPTPSVTVEVPPTSGAVHFDCVQPSPHEASKAALESAAEDSEFAEVLASLREGDKDPVLNATVRELIYHSVQFIVYLDQMLRVQYRGVWAFPAGSEGIRFELSRLESLTLAN